jgi:two-component system, NtrC family, sensor kinase
MSPSATELSTTPGRLDPGYLESLFQGAGFAIIACRPDGEIVAGNAAASRLFGRRNLAGRVSALFPERDRQAVEHLLESVQTSLEMLEFQTRLGSAATDSIEYAVWFTPVLEPDGTLRGVSLWFRDITQRMQLQRALDRRGRLASLGTLSGAVAHHYNNLLCCIATSVEYAINMNTLTAMRRALQRTADAVGRAAKITQQLLTFAQADHRGGDLADLTEVVLLFLDENEERFGRLHIKLQVDWQVIPVIAVRRDQLLVILSNVVDNSVEAMAEGGALTVTLGRRDDDSVALSISDTGPGINPAHMEHLFEPFFTTKGELGSGDARNAGMGLAVAHGLVGEMHGTITGSNVPGHGARFDIVLPIKPPGAERG